MARHAIRGGKFFGALFVSVVSGLLTSFLDDRGKVVVITRQKSQSG